MSGMTRDTIRNAPEGSEASGSGQHQGDAGSDAYDRDFALSVLAKEQDALYEVEQALYRIKTGTYGNCEISGHKIPTARLEAIPFRPSDGRMPGGLGKGIRKQKVPTLR